MTVEVGRTLSTNETGEPGPFDLARLTHEQFIYLLRHHRYDRDMGVPGAARASLIWRAGHQLRLSIFAYSRSSSNRELGWANVTLLPAWTYRWRWYSFTTNTDDPERPSYGLVSKRGVSWLTQDGVPVVQHPVAAFLLDVAAESGPQCTLEVGNDLFAALKPAGTQLNDSPFLMVGPLLVERSDTLEPDVVRVSSPPARSGDPQFCNSVRYAPALSELGVATYVALRDSGMAIDAATTAASLVSA